MVFKDKLNEIFGLGAPTVVVPQEEKPRDVIELTTIDDFRNNIRQKLNGIKSDAIMGVVSSTPISAPAPTPIDQPCGDGVLVERENEIKLDTLKGSVKKMGPQKVSEVIAKLSVDQNEVDAKTGVATSEFDKFISGLKQEAIEILLGAESGTPTAETPPVEGATSEEPKAPAEKLPDLVQTKL